MKLEMAVFLVLVARSSTSASQIPETFTNLTILPPDITRRELIDTMRDFSTSLDVRCEFCHAGEGGPALANMDFASDEKAAKRTARTMLAMVSAINGEHLAKLGKESPTRVDCYTCHHGLSRPGRIETEVEEALDASGIAGAIARYRALKEEHYGSAAYDFSVGPLNGVGELLLGEGRPEEATALLELNAESFPDSGWLQHLLGEGYLAAGDREKARIAFERSLALEPSNGMAKKRLEEIERTSPK